MRGPAQMVWEDSTSYSQGDTARAPSQWTCYVGPIRIVINKPWRAGCDDEDWRMSCYGPLPMSQSLRSREIESAKLETISLAIGTADRIGELLRRLLFDKEQVAGHRGPCAASKDGQ